MRKFRGSPAIALALAGLLPAFGQQPDLRRQAQALKAKGDAAGALTMFERAAEAAPRDAGLRDEIGFLDAVLGRQSEAIESFRAAISLNAAYAPAHYHL